MMGLVESLREAGEALGKRQDAPMSIASLCELFVRNVTRIALTQVSVEGDFEKLKQLLIERGETLARATLEARTKIARAGADFVEAGGQVLTLGYSRAVVALLLAAAKTKHFSVVVAESHPEGDGHKTAAQLADAGVPVTVVEDAAVAYAMSRCQMVLVGAEAVLESGGVINKIGTCARALAHAPRLTPLLAVFVCLCRVRALSRVDVLSLSRAQTRWQSSPRRARTPSTSPPSRPSLRATSLSPRQTCPHMMHRAHSAFVGREPPANLTAETHTRDYTPPSYITMLFTDLGVLTPSAVSDELIKLFD